jgi:feruloyl-CoA synthase
MNLLAAFDGAVRKHSDKTFLRSGDVSISYGEMKARSHRAAAVLAEAGVGPGDAVALMCFNTPEFVDALLGAWRLSAMVVPMNHKLQAPEVEYILWHSGAKVLVFDASLADVVSDADAWARPLSTGGKTRFDSFDDKMRQAGKLVGTEPDDDTIAEILYTSGTTGRPKGCILTHRSVTLAAITVALALSITREERILIAMPIWHSSPLNNWFAATMYVGGTVVLIREYNPLAFLETAQREKITFYFGAPVSYTAPLQLDVFDTFDLSSVRAWLYGGGPISADLAKRLATSYRSDRFYQVYGMTETGPVGTALYPEEQELRAGSIGRNAMPGVDLRVVRADGSDALRGETGEIWMRTDSMMSGYLNDEDATNAAFENGNWYRTGDVARLGDDGYLFIVDRLKDMIITGGENVYSKEIEDVLSGHPAASEVAVYGIPRGDWGETVVAAIVPKIRHVLNADDVREYLVGRLAKFKIPRQIHFLERLPRTPMGKVQKYLLRQSRVGGDTIPPSGA